MTETDRMSPQPECGEDAAAFVLGALAPHEAEAFRQHMAGCAVCRDEVAAFRYVVDALPMAAPQHGVSRALRRRVLKSVRSEPRHAPDAGPRNRRRPFVGSAFRRPALGLGVILVLALAILGGVELRSTSNGSRLIQASVIGSPGSAQLRLTGGRGELIVRNMPQPPAGHVYEVWLQRGKSVPSPTSALFSVTSAGAGDVGIPGNLRGVSRVLVTPEPDGGSRVPTHPPVVVAQLS